MSGGFRILANAGATNFNAPWIYFTNSTGSTNIRVAFFVVDDLMYRICVDFLYNRDGSGFNPCLQPPYMLLNLAMGGMNGGDPSQTSFPNRFEIDYVRVYQK